MILNRSVLNFKNYKRLYKLHVSIRSNSIRIETYLYILNRLIYYTWNIASISTTKTVLVQQTFIAI